MDFGVVGGVGVVAVVVVVASVAVLWVMVMVVVEMVVLVVVVGVVVAVVVVGCAWGVRLAVAASTGVVWALPKRSGKFGAPPAMGPAHGPHPSAAVVRVAASLRLMPAALLAAMAAVTAAEAFCCFW